MLFFCSLALLPFVNYISLRICCIICLRFYIIDLFVIFIYLFKFLLFSERNNIEVLFRLSSSYRIEATMDFLFLICTIKLMLLLLNYCRCCC